MIQQFQTVCTGWFTWNDNTLSPNNFFHNNIKEWYNSTRLYVQGDSLGMTLLCHLITSFIIILKNKTTGIVIYEISTRLYVQGDSLGMTLICHLITYFIIILKNDTTGIVINGISTRLYVQGDSLGMTLLCQQITCFRKCI